MVQRALSCVCINVTSGGRIVGFFSATLYYAILLARDAIYTSRTYATMSVSICLSVCLWRNGSALVHYKMRAKRIPPAPVISHWIGLDTSINVCDILLTFSRMQILYCRPRLRHWVCSLIHYGILIATVQLSWWVNSQLTRFDFVFRCWQDDKNYWLF